MKLENYLLNFIFITSTIIIFSKLFNSLIGLLISISLAILLFFRRLTKQKHLLKTQEIKNNYLFNGYNKLQVY